MTVTFQHNVSLKPYNTLAVDVTAADFCTVTSVEALQQALDVMNEKSLLGPVPAGIFFIQPIKGN